MQGSNRSGLQCLQHPNEQITNYCLHFDCLKPLCPDCVQLHTKYHQKQEIQSWKHCVNKCARNIKGTLDTLRTFYDRNNQYQSFKSVEVIESQNIKRLNSIKQKVMRLVDDVFNVYEQKLRNVIRMQYRVDPPDLTKLKMAIDELEKLLMKLGHSSTVLPALKTSLTLDYESLKNFFGNMQYGTKKTELNEWFIMEVQDPIKLRPYIQDLVKINVGEIQRQQVITTSYNQQVFGTPSNYRSPGPDRVLSGRGGAASYGGPIQISRRNYFNESCQFKNLHFFIPSSTELKILPIEDALRGVDAWKSIIYKSKQPLPCFFKSVVTPSGEIYVTGGYDNDRRYRDIYRYNYDKNSLDLVSKMINERSSHSACYQNGCIYILGGFSRKDGIVSQDCQVFRLSTQTCEPISALNTPSANSCAIPFGQNYILKVGGSLGGEQETSAIIQIYDIRMDKWAIVSVTGGQIEMLSFSAGVQINETDVLVFGGYDNSIKERPQRVCYCLEIDTENLRAFVKSFNEYPLPYPEGFWNNNPIIHNGRVIALQNVTDQHDEQTALADERRVVVFDGVRWI